MCIYNYYFFNTLVVIYFILKIKVSWGHGFVQGSRQDLKSYISCAQTLVPKVHGTSHKSGPDGFNSQHLEKVGTQTVFELYHTHQFIYWQG